MGNGTYDLYYNEAAKLSTGSMTAVSIISLIYSVLIIIALWKIFKKAGEPGWAAIIPFYCQYTQFKIGFKNGWLFLLIFVPIVGFIMMGIILPIKIASAFGKSGLFALGLIFLPFIFYLILGFDNSKYVEQK